MQQQSSKSMERFNMVVILIDIQALNTLRFINRSWKEARCKHWQYLKKYIINGFSKTPVSWHEVSNINIKVKLHLQIVDYNTEARFV